MQFEKYIIFNDDHCHCVSVNNRDECVDEIVKEYHDDYVSMHEILASTVLEGFTLEDTVYIYAKCMNISDGDTLIHLRDEWDLYLDDEEILGKN